MTSYDKPDSLDGAIDAAVREMMQVDPRPGLRHRVAGSIGARTRRSLPFRFGLPALAAAMLVLLSVLILRPSAPSSPVHAPQVAATTPAAPANPLAGPRTAGPRTAGPQTAGPQTADRSTENAGSTPRISAPVPGAPAARPRRRSAPTPESIFGGRSDRITAASIPGASAEPPGHDVLEMAPELHGLESGFGITPLRLEPIQVIPITIQPLSFNTLPRR